MPVFPDATLFQALSIDPINAHVMELLNLALESNAQMGLGGLVPQGEFEKYADKLKSKYTSVAGKSKVRELSDIIARERAAQPDVPEDVQSEVGDMNI